MEMPIKLWSRLSQRYIYFSILFIQFRSVLRSLLKIFYLPFSFQFKNVISVKDEREIVGSIGKLYRGSILGFGEMISMKSFIG